MKSPFAWDEKYSVGHPELDEQHRSFLALCKKSCDALAAESLAAREAYHLLLDDLTRHASKHFETEEAILADHGYPDLDHHRREHSNYLEGLVDILLAAADGVFDADRLCTFVTSWWVNHIAESDKRFASTIRA
jgi:hemerythrin